MEEKPRHTSPPQASSGLFAGKNSSEKRRPSQPLDSTNPSDDEKSRTSAPASIDGRGDAHPHNNPRPDGRRELKEWEAWDKLAYSWPKWKKAMYLASIAGIQISMNFNTSVYPSAVKPLSEHFGISQQAARVGQMIYLVFYSFGCELWAPWSEEFGRWPILQLSMLLINIWEIPCSVAPNFATIIVCRALVGLSKLLSTHILTILGWSFNRRRQCNTWTDRRSIRARDSTLAIVLHRALLNHRYQYWRRHRRSH